MNPRYTFYDQEALLQRLSTGIWKRSQEVIFLVGAPLSAPITPGGLGVPGVDEVINLIRSEFDSNSRERYALQEALSGAGAKAYQVAFTFLQGRRGQHTANEIIAKAVLAARTPGSIAMPIDFRNPSAGEAACQALDTDIAGWHLSPGVECLGQLASDYPAVFGKVILTTNFDPLIEIAVQRSGGSYYRTTLHSDAHLGQTQASGCHVIHLHGFWHGADTLHTPTQLSQPRPHLKDSLRSLVRDKLIAVCAYSGWDDAFTESLMEIVRDLTEYPEVLWTFHSAHPQLGESLERQLIPGLNRGRVNLYAAIDCNVLFPCLHRQWAAARPPNAHVVVQSNPVSVAPAISFEVSQQRNKPTIIEGNDEDRPPVVDICVGRDDELTNIRKSTGKVVFVTGMGGQGKSTVAAKYFVGSQVDAEFSFYVWRDCKEERERFENQLLSMIETLSGGMVSGQDLAQQTPESIIQFLLSLIENKSVLFTFDNIDHYVDLERRRMTGAADIFISALLKSRSPSRAVFTCRPGVSYNDHLALSIHLEGISLDAAADLFSQRSSPSTFTEIEEAYELTKGHTFWLDLLASQVVKNPSVSLHALVSQIGSGTDLVPEKTLRSIWRTLRPREQTVMRAMAETLKPETDEEVSDYLSGELTHQKVVKALKTLRALNLIVIKKPLKGADLLELHPLVRHFIRHSFPENERISYINRIISVYQRFRGNHKSDLARRPSLVLLQYWTQNAELDTAAGRFADAFFSLSEVGSAFMGSAYPREFTRAARNLLESVDWVSRHSEFEAFEPVFGRYIHFLCDLGDVVEVERLLEKYEISIPSKDVRYIRYCDLRCYFNWARDEFTNAVRWGKRGHDLKTTTGVDTRYDVSHNLALAERDSGRPETGLTMFLRGRNLAEVVDPTELDLKIDGSYYGNIGRCLHLMGQVGPALACYQKSALLLERAQQQNVVNQGYIRAWVGELLISRHQLALAYVFLRAAFVRWQHTSPPKAARVQQLAAEVKGRVQEIKKVDSADAESTWLDWVLGKNLDSEFE